MATGVEEETSFGVGARRARGGALGGRTRRDRRRRGRGELR
jgi:hypothetical protein